MLTYLKSPLLRYAAATAGLCVILLAVSGLMYDRNLVEKMLTRLALPLGVIWLGLLGNMLVAWSQPGALRRGFATGLFFVFWLLGSSWFADRLAASLEARYPPVDPQQVEPFDVLIVLGGATSSNARGDTWLSFAGDRVMLAARLYQQGRVKRLVTTGKMQIWTEGKGLDPSEATLRMWRDLGIPEEHVTQLGGINTSREMDAIRDFLGESPPPRVGLLTSAFHLPRAERLARRHGIQVIPVPAGFLSPMEEPLPLAILPSGGAVQVVDYAVREYLAAIVQR